MYPGHGEDIDALLQSAEAALYAATSAHRSLEVYSPDCNRYTPERLALLGELRGAIAAGELVLHYQLKIDLASGEVRTVEALVRSQHPERDLIPPGEFAPFAGHSGVIRPLTACVLDAALARCAAWRAEGVEVAWRSTCRRPT